MRSIHGSSLKIKFKTPQKLSCSEGITHTTTQTTMMEPKTICLPCGGGGRQIYKMSKATKAQNKIAQTKLPATKKSKCTFTV